MANSPQSTAHSSATDSSFKRQKIPNEQAEFNNTIDRISSLPDSILCHILSFLPTKLSVATSILSIRWKYLWTLVPCLDFDYETDSPYSDNASEDSLDIDDAAMSNPVDRVGYMSFVHFVYRVLVLRNASCIKKFCLKCYTNCNSFHFNAWVCAAITRDVEELDLFMSLRKPVELPRILFTCKTLKFLKLSYHIVLNVPSSVHFPTLKILHLISVKYENDYSFQKLLNGCPVLEDLFIEISDSEQTFNISAPALKKLTVKCDIAYNRSTYELEINAPALEYLNLIDFMPEDVSIENLSSLVEANIDAYRVFEDAEYNGNCVFELLKGLSNVKHLTLSGNTTEALGYASNDDLPIFHNMTQLEMCIRWRDWHVLPNLLESSHNLEVLILELEKSTFSCYERESCLKLPQHVPKCLLLHLLTIDIRGFVGLEVEFKLVTYFLENANVLKAMNIFCGRLNLEAKFLHLQKLSMCPRASKTCGVAFSETSSPWYGPSPFSFHTWFDD